MNKWKRNLKGLVRKKPFAFFDIFLYHIVHNNLLQRAAGLSYFFTLAIFPFFIALLNIVNFINVNYLSSILGVLENFPPEIASLMTSFMKDLQLNSSSTLLSISLISTIYIASKGIKQVIVSLNDVLDIAEKRNAVALIILSFIMTVGLFALILLIFVTQVLGSNLLSFVFNLLNLPAESYQMIQLLMRLVPLFFMFVSFFCLYYFCPKWPNNYRPPKRMTLTSAMFSTISIILATTGFGFYVSNFSNYANTYGSLAGMIVFLVWLYLFGLILLLGGAVQASMYTLEQKGPAWPRDETMFGDVVATHERIY